MNRRDFGKAWSFRVGAGEEVTFTQLTAAANTHRDAVRFDNGREILLQRLKKGSELVCCNYL